MPKWVRKKTKPCKEKVIEAIKSGKKTTEAVAKALDLPKPAAANLLARMTREGTIEPIGKLHAEMWQREWQVKVRNDHKFAA